MAGSFYAKLRKQAKDKEQIQKGKGATGGVSIDEMMNKTEQATPDPISQEELTMLLETLNPPEEKPSVITTEQAEEKKLTIEDKQKLFHAYGTYYNKNTKKFIQVTIEYNPVSNYTRVVSTEELADNKMVAVSKLVKTIGMKLTKLEEVL